MYELTEGGKMSMVSLCRQIFQNNPPIQVLNMARFSRESIRDDDIGELVLDALLSSNIKSITDLNLSHNPTWFVNSNAGDLLAELISK